LGKILARTYRIDMLVDRGAIGAVYRGVNLRGESPVAIRVVRPSLANQQQLMERMALGMKTQAKLHHPHLLGVHDFVSENGLNAIVMEYVDGMTLEEVIYQQGGPMALGRIRALMGPVLKAMDAVHRQGIIHGGLKPSKIMIVTTAGEEVPKVMGFGLAKILADLGIPVVSSDPLTALGYRSPEACRSVVTMDARSDIYALGVILFEMATGRMPFAAEKEEDLMKAHLEQAPPLPREVYPEVHPELEALILQALEKAPERRAPQTTAAFYDALMALGATHASGRTISGLVEIEPEPLPPVVLPPDMAAAATIEDTVNLGKNKKRGKAAAPSFESNESTDWLPSAHKKQQFKSVALIFLGLLSLFGAIGVLTIKPSPSSSPLDAVPPKPLESVRGLSQKTHSSSLPSSTLDKAAMVRVPAGEFLWGSKEDADEGQPSAKIWLHAFDIDQHEVTVAQYQACVATRRCSKPAAGEYCNGHEAERQNHPINCVNWHQAHTYCQWAGKRLPSEIEWEKAARGTDGRTYPWGEEEPSCSRAIFGEHGDGCGKNSTWPVGSTSPMGDSPYGVQDMAGNVWEWVSTRVLRGGSWDDLANNLRAARRHSFPPQAQNHYLGFRCARTP
jgi:formylglycine-generating enzyme required for sulfatase activity